MDTVPFQITNVKDLSKGVHVYDPLSADYLAEGMTTTHDHFQENPTGLLEKSMDRLFGEVSKGIQTSEKMMGVGVNILGFGKLIYEDAKMKLIPPTGGQAYILTTMDKQELLRRLRGTAVFWKVFAAIVASAAIGIGAYICVTRYQSWKDKVEMYWLQQELRRRREAEQERRVPHRGADTDNSNNDASPEEMCTVCLERPREVIVLDCGHICVCGDCAQALPLPRKCPVCRGDIVRILPIYRS